MNDRARNFYKDDVMSLTLRQALDGYYSINEGFTPWDQLKSPRAQKLLRSHDIAHIVFGCDTSLAGEVEVRFWSKFGAIWDISFTEKIRTGLAFEGLALVANRQAIPYSLTNFAAIRQIKAEVTAQASRMTKKWPFFAGDLLLGSQVATLRRDYGIEITRR